MSIINYNLRKLNRIPGAVFQGSSWHVAFPGKELSQASLLESLGEEGGHPKLPGPPLEVRPIQLIALDL